MKRHVLIAVFIHCLVIGFCFSCGSEEKEGTDPGVWKDASTGLLWQEPPLSDKVLWAGAMEYCENLMLDGKDDWRLPSIVELRGLIRGCDSTVTGGACAVDDECLNSFCRGGACDGCEDFTGPGVDGCHRDPDLTGDCMFYWSSTTAPDAPGDAWCVGFGGAHVKLFPKTGQDIGSIRCVRG